MFLVSREEDPFEVFCPFTKLDFNQMYCSQHQLCYNLILYHKPHGKSFSMKLITVVSG